ncbi:hypothetical protein ABH917_001178 [Thermobifida halotolerans]
MTDASSTAQPSGSPMNAHVRASSTMNWLRVDGLRMSSGT